MIQPHDSVIVRTLGHIVIPIAQLFGVYVLVFGQHGPGGGFVGGVVLAASMILAILIFGINAPDSVLARKYCMAMGSVFLFSRALAASV